VAGAPHDRPRAVRQRRPADGDLRRQQGGRRVHAQAGVRPGADADVEGADQARHRRGPEPEGVRGRLQAVTGPAAGRVAGAAGGRAGQSLPPGLAVRVNFSFSGWTALPPMKTRAGWSSPANSGLNVTVDAFALSFSSIPSIFPRVTNRYSSV